MSCIIKRTSQFKKDVKLMLKQGKDLQKLLDVIELLQKGDVLPENLHDHALTGNWAGTRECHIEPDWLLIYEKCESVLILTLLRTGSHSTLL